MWLRIEGVLTKDEVAEARDVIGKIDYQPAQRQASGAGGGEGGGESGDAVRYHKNNLQIPVGHPEVKPAATLIGKKLMDHPEFNVFAWPKNVQMLFNRYEKGMTYAQHNDAALMQQGPGKPFFRTDLSFTVSLSEPDEYDGGDFVAQFYGEERRVRLPAGDAMVYLPDTLHGVEPISAGARWMLVGWIQSYVPDPKEREILYNYCKIFKEVMEQLDDRDLKRRMEQVRDQLLRRWSQV